LSFASAQAKGFLPLSRAVEEEENAENGGGIIFLRIQNEKMGIASQKMFG